MSAPAQHLTVLLREAVEALAIKPAGIYVDGTFGRGGHSREILKALDPQGRLIALDRVPVREHTELQNAEGVRLGEVTSGLLGPTIDKPVAMAYVPPEYAAIGQRVNAIVRGKPVPMEVVAMPFVPTRYFRG